jgi:hypothetical protein
MLFCFLPKVCLSFFSWAVKSQDTNAVGQQLKQCKIRPSCVFVSLQNGTKYATHRARRLPTRSNFLTQFLFSPRVQERERFKGIPSTNE